MAHTPGPWTVKKSGSFAWAIRGNWHGQDSHLALVDAMICQIKGPFYDEQAANARLMAAAPDLLKCLRAWVESTHFSEQTGSMAPVYEAARAAIAKAEG